MTSGVLGGPVTYLDSSALVKLVVREDETPALRSWLAQHRDHRQATSVIAQVEVRRAVRRAAPTDGAAHSRAVAVLGAVERIALGPDIAQSAALLEPADLRSLDAIHLASALSIGSDLAALVAYDARLIDAARALGMAALGPGREE